MNQKIRFTISLLILSLCTVMAAGPYPRSAREWKVILSADTLDLFLKDQKAGTLVQSTSIKESSRTIVVERYDPSRDLHAMAS